jgi:hypothetical protein
LPQIEPYKATAAQSANKPFMMHFRSAASILVSITVVPNVQVAATGLSRRCLFTAQAQSKAIPTYSRHVDRENETRQGLQFCRFKFS